MCGISCGSNILCAGINERDPIFGVVNKTVFTETDEIDTSGGTLEIEDGPLKGTEVYIPTDAVDRTIHVSVGYEQNFSSGESLEGLGDTALVIDTSGFNNFKLPIEITMPCDAVEDDTVPIPLYLDEGTGSLLPVTVDDYGDAGTVTFLAFHASRYVLWYADTSDISVEYSSGFRPKNDGFHEVNDGSSLLDNGECFAFSSFAAWYSTPGITNHMEHYIILL